MAKITIKELESLTTDDAGRILREDGNLAGRVSVRKDGVSVSFFYIGRRGITLHDGTVIEWAGATVLLVRP